MIYFINRIAPRWLIVLILFQSVGFSQNPDIELLRKINIHSNRDVDNSFFFLTNTSHYLAAAVPVTVLGWGIMKKDSLTVRNGLIGVAAIISSAAAGTLIKYGVGRPRPFVEYPDIRKRTGGDGPSFPSCHTSNAFATATALSLAYHRWYVVAPAFLWAAAVGYSRLYLGVHYPSDVLAGALIGTGSAYLWHVIADKTGIAFTLKKRRGERALK